MMPFNSEQVHFVVYVAVIFTIHQWLEMSDATVKFFANSQLYAVTVNFYISTSGHITWAEQAFRHARDQLAIAERACTRAARIAPRYITSSESFLLNLDIMVAKSEKSSNKTGQGFASEHEKQLQADRALINTYRSSWKGNGSWGHHICT